jgi:hypothetical protein
MIAAIRPLAILVALAELAACDIERPFERAWGEGELNAPETTILCVAPIADLPPALAEALRTALAEELVKRETLANAADPCPPTAPRILSWTVEADNGQAPPLLMFSRPTGTRPVPPLAISLTAPDDPAQWTETAERWATMLADRLGYFPPAVRSVRAPFDLSFRRSATPPPLAPVAADDPARVFVDTVDGATGDGNTLLRFAMLGHLRRFGLKPEAETAARASSPYFVKGRVDIGEARTVEGSPPLRRVRIVWSVSDAKGRVLGSLEQANDIPAAALDRAWGQAADAVAAAAADKIAEILRLARAASAETATNEAGKR